MLEPASPAGSSQWVRTRPSHVRKQTNVRVTEPPSQCTRRFAHADPRHATQCDSDRLSCRLQRQLVCEQRSKEDEHLCQNRYCAVVQAKAWLLGW